MSNLTVNQLNAASVNISGGITMAGPFNINKALNEVKGADIPAASTTDIWSGNDGNLIHITGSGAIINSFGTPTIAGSRRNLIIDGVITIKNNGTTMQLPGNTDYISTAGDRLVVMADTDVNNILFDYSRGDGGTITLLANLDSTLAGSTNVGGGAIGNTIQWLPPNGFVGYRELFIEVDKVMHSSNANVTFAATATGNASMTWGSYYSLTANITTNTSYTSGTIRLSGLGANTDLGLFVSSVLSSNASGTPQTNTSVGLMPLPGAHAGLQVNGVQFGFLKTGSGTAGNYKSGCIRIYGIK